MKPKPKLLLLACSLLIMLKTFSQDSDLLKIVGVDAPKKEYVTGAFKSTRVIMSHSLEMLRPGVLDFRILHRFGAVSGGVYQFFGLDQATFRLSLDYGITRNLTAGFGRSSYKKELDGFLKYQLIQQSTGPKSSPLSLIIVGGMTVRTENYHDLGTTKHNNSDRLAYYWQGIVGRKFSEAFTLQLVPTFLHRNKPDQPGDDNDIFAMGIGGRMKLSKRVSFNVDYYAVLHKDVRSGLDETFNPLSVGFDIETGGHVFQLHFTNAQYMNERAFLMETTSNWGEGQIAFGFNISRAFQVRKKKG